MTRLYRLTAALLIVHEMDSAYWREWQLFGLPGGIEGFLALHVALALALLWGHERAIAGSRSGLWMALAVGGSGVATGAIHGAFLVRGASEFRTPASLALIGAAAVAGLALSGRAATSLRRGEREAAA
jgi:hypothetical protein